MKTTIHRYLCSTCPHRAIYQESVPKKVSGVVLKFGTVYCTGGKKFRVFKPKDPKVYPPSWCPRQKSPAEYRVYAYKDVNTWYIRRQLQKTDSPISPSGYEYAVRIKGHTELTARGFLEATENDFPSNILGFLVHDGEVLEIDDGLQPYFFHITACGVKVLPLFNREAALKNRYKGAIGS